MADDTQGKAQQKPATTGPGNAKAVDKGEAAADRRTVRPATETRVRPAAEPAEDKRPTAEEIEKREPKTYRALERGYVDGRIVEAGDVFTTKADKGAWMEKVKKSEGYGVDQAVDEAGYAKKADVDYEGMSEPALEALAALVGVSKPGELNKDDLIAAIKAARIPAAQ
jgi:hypothetical protein